MSMNWKGALSAGAVIGASVLAACSDSPVSPASRTAFIPKSSFAVGDETSATAVAGYLKICKYGDASGTFTVTDVGDGQPGEGRPGGTGNPSVIGPNYVIAAGTEQAPNCRIVVEDFGDGDQNKGDFFTVSEADAAGVTETVISCTINGGAVLTCPTNFFINDVHGWTILVRNITDAPPPRCTYTKGWYQSKHATDGVDRDIIPNVDGLTVEQQSLVFNTRPNKFATITWDGGNNGLNLYQQFLAALNNLNNNEDAGPDAVDDAIDLVQDNTSFDGSHITINLTQEQISAAIGTLSSFNEGSYRGYPHCGDEILPL